MLNTSCGAIFRLFSSRILNRKNIITFLFCSNFVSKCEKYSTVHVTLRLSFIIFKECDIICTRLFFRLFYLLKEESSEVFHIKLSMHMYVLFLYDPLHKTKNMRDFYNKPIRKERKNSSNKRYTHNKNTTFFFFILHTFTKQKGTFCIAI